MMAGRGDLLNDDDMHNPSFIASTRIIRFKTKSNHPDPALSEGRPLP